MLPASLKVIGWAVALGLPLAIAYLLHKKEAWPAALAAGWIVVLGFLPVPWTYWARNDDTGTLAAFLWHGLSSFLWTAFGSSLLIWWGVREHRRERINMGIVGFALSVVSFYFSQLFDMLGRSWSLILLGVIFLGGGYLMERTRRRLLAQIATEGARA